MENLKDLFREWREDEALRKAEEKLRREGPRPEQQQQQSEQKQPEKKERDQDQDRGR